MARIAGTSDGRAAAMRKSFMRLHSSAKECGQTPSRGHMPRLRLVHCNNSTLRWQSAIVTGRIRAPEAAGSCAGRLVSPSRPNDFFADLQQFGCMECNNRNISLPPVSSLLYCRGASRKANGRDPSKQAVSGTPRAAKQSVGASVSGCHSCRELRVLANAIVIV
jgi:hypothetical protein